MTRVMNDTAVARQLHPGSGRRKGSPTPKGRQVDPVALSEIRGPAAVAQQLYHETDASKEARARAAQERKAMQEFAPLPERRPSKRDRRRIIQFRGGR